MHVPVLCHSWKCGTNNFQKFLSVLLSHYSIQSSGHSKLNTFKDILVCESEKSYRDKSGGCNGFSNTLAGAMWRSK
jgi:hypothetical protein